MLLPPHQSTHAEFVRDPEGPLRRLRKTSQPMGITLRGRMEAVLVTPEQFEAIARKEDLKALEESMRQFDAGKGVPWEKAKKMLLAKRKARARARRKRA